MSWPIVFEQPRERAVGEDPPVGLAARAVVRLVIGITDPLHGRAADRARLAEATVDGHLRTERGHLLGEAVAGLGPEPLDPFDEDLTRGEIEPLDLRLRQLLRECQRRQPARWRISSEYALPMPLKRCGSLRALLSV